MAKTRIKLAGTDIAKLNAIIDAIREITTRAGVIVRGPMFLPTRHLKITTRKSPCGDGKASFDRFEMRIHKRLIDMPSDERVLHSIMRMPIPRDINVEIEIIE